MPVLLVKQRVSVTEPPFVGGFRYNLCDSSLASRKARSRLPIGYDYTFLLALTAVSYTHLTLPTNREV